jgi:hypothetical protein
MQSVSSLLTDYGISTVVEYICSIVKEKTTFTVPSGHYKFNRLPFGLSNSPTTFECLIDVILAKLIGKECWVFVNDLIVFSRTVQEHAERLAHVLDRFEKANLKLQPKKCTIAPSKVEYLGHVLAKEGVKPNPVKVKAIENYTVPKTVKTSITLLSANQ